MGGKEGGRRFTCIRRITLYDLGDGGLNCVEELSVVSYSMLYIWVACIIAGVVGIGYGGGRKGWKGGVRSWGQGCLRTQVHLNTLD